MTSGANNRAAHLGNLATATLKFLILNAESDDIRFRAAEALLSLPGVRRKQELAATVLDPPQPRDGSVNRPAILGKRLRRLMDSGSDTAQEALRLIEQAEREAGLTSNPREHAPNPLSE